MVDVASGHLSACHFWDEVADEVLREAAATGIAAHEGRLE
jgi:hypothetical protein